MSFTALPPCVAPVCVPTTEATPVRCVSVFVPATACARVGTGALLDTRSSEACAWTMTMCTIYIPLTCAQSTHISLTFESATGHLTTGGLKLMPHGLGRRRRRRRRRRPHCCQSLPIELPAEDGGRAHLQWRCWRCETPSCRARAPHEKPPPLFGPPDPHSLVVMLRAGERREGDVARERQRWSLTKCL
jgi:hypothetical protein